MGNSPVNTMSYHETGKCSLFHSCSSLTELDVDELAIHREIGVPRGRICTEAMRFMDSNSKALLFAAMSPNPELVRRYLSYGASPDTYDQNRTSPLHIACREGSMEVVKELISHRCNLSIADCAGWTSLHIASHRGHSDIVEFLLACGAEATSVNSHGQTPFDLARDYSTKKKFIKYWGVQDVQCDNEGRDKRPLTPYSQESSVTSDLWMKFGKISYISSYKYLEETLKNIYNNDFKKGLSMLVIAGIIDQNPSSIARFLHENQKLNPAKIGETLGEPSDFFREVCKEYMNLIEIEHHNLLDSLSRVLRLVKLPKGLLSDQIISIFAQRFFRIDGPFNSVDSVHHLVFNIINLNYQVHTLQEEPRKEEFFLKNKGMHDGGDFPEKYLTWIYESVLTEPLDAVFYQQIAPVFEEVLHSGYLKYKIGNDWKEKYFIFNSGTLWCFKSSTQITPNGFLPIKSNKVKVKGKFFSISGDVVFWKINADGAACLQRYKEILFKMDSPDAWIGGFQSMIRT
jgi:hypothetical protein